MAMIDRQDVDGGVPSHQRCRRPARPDSLGALARLKSRIPPR
ncbi:hypothetical protein [Roseateles saccharophilus]|nr:hypothetical protein [Roseateles saccharophilus]